MKKVQPTTPSSSSPSSPHHRLPLLEQRSELFSPRSRRLASLVSQPRGEAGTARARLGHVRGELAALREKLRAEVEAEWVVAPKPLRGFSAAAEAQAAKDKAAEAVVAAREVLQPRAAPAEVAAAAAPVVDATAPGQSTRPSRHIKRRRQFDEAQDQSAPAKAARGGGGAGAPAPGAGAGAGAGASTALPPSTSKRLKEAENELDLAT